MRTISKVILHCSDSPDSNQKVDAAEIDRWHKARGWSGIGYHWVIKRDGTIEAGRPETQVGAHVQGHNQDSIGICWVGRKTLKPEQKAALLKLVRRILAGYQLTSADVYGHYEFQKGKTCPNLDMAALRKEI